MIYPSVTPSPNTGATDFGPGFWLGLSALVVTIVAIPIAVVATRRWGNRRAVLTWATEAVSLIPDEGGDNLEVTYRDFPVKDPVLVTVALANKGPRDISSEMFDNGRPIHVHLAVPFYGVTKVQGNAKVLMSPALGAKAEEAVLTLSPFLIKRREGLVFSAIVSGQPTVRIEAPLVDTDVKQLVPPAPAQGVLVDVFSVIADVVGVFFTRRR